jgi:hypothetical protein
VPGSGEVGPDAGVRASGQEVEGQRRKRGYDRLDEGLTAGPVLRGRPVHAMQQLRGRNCGDADLLIRPQLSFQSPAHLGHGFCRWQGPDSALKVDEDRGV